MIRSAPVAATALARAAVAGTLAYAVWPVPMFVAVAVLLDAMFGAIDGRDRLRNTTPARSMIFIEFASRIAMLMAAMEGVFAGRRFRFANGVDGSGLAIVMIWLAPIVLGRVVTTLLMGPISTPRVHADEQVRRAALSTGAVSVVIAACAMWLLRSNWSVAWLCMAIGATLIAAALVMTRRRRRWVASVRDGAIASQRLEPLREGSDLPELDEAPDSVVVEGDAPTFRSADARVASVRARGGWFGSVERRLARFAAIAVVVTALFDAACWHGSGWIPMRHQYGDPVTHVVFMRDAGLIEWQVRDSHPARARWNYRKREFETHGEWFARIAPIERAETLAINVPTGTCARPGFVRRAWYGGSPGPRTLDELSRIIEPIKRDGRVLYTSRREDGKLVRVDLALDGRSATCLVDPPPVDDGPLPERLPPPDELKAGRSHTCARVKDGLACWGDEITQFNPAVRSGPHAIPGIVAAAGEEFVVGDGFTCTREKKTIFCWGDPVNRPFAGSGPHAAKLFAGGRYIAIDSPEQPLRILPAHLIMEPPEDVRSRTDIAQVAVATDRACARFGGGSLRCWGPTAPSLESDAPVDEVALGEVLACMRKGGEVWCARITERPRKVEGLPPIASIDVGDEHACALAINGGVWCWGRNMYGELGDGTLKGRLEPRKVLEDATAVATGGSHTCAISKDGKVRCWGRNDSGQLGDGTVVDRTKPVEVVR